MEGIENLEKYTVYKITNQINNKSYIGSSIHVERRWREHKNSAFNSNSPCYHYPLYKAFRKYGIENFSFEILKDNFSSFEDMRDYEKDMIIFYNSCNEGYNQTYETYPERISVENLEKIIEKQSQKCAKVDMNNNIIEIYKSYHDAAQKNGYDRDKSASMIRRICKGEIRSLYGMIFKDIDENGKVIDVVYKTRPRRQQVYSLNVLTLEEKYYESILAASQETGLERARIQKCISGSQKFSIIHNLIFRKVDEYGNIIEIPNTPTVKEKLDDFNQKNPVINNVRHNITEWCEIYGLSTASFYYRRRQGMSVLEALTLPKRR